MLNDDYDNHILEIRRAPRTFRELHERCENCNHPYHDHFNPDDQCWCNCCYFRARGD